MSQISYEIVEKIGILSETPTGWSKQINLISWNQREPKLDIRDWAPENEKMGKGITLSKAEARRLREYLQDLDLD